MLIAAGLAILAIFLGGPQNDLLILKMDKHIKEYVIDKDTQKAIMTEIKAVKKQQKSYQKDTKKHTKQLKALVGEQSADQAAFDAIFLAANEFETKMNEAFISRRILIQDLMTEEEWDQVIAASGKTFKKEQKTSDKTLSKGKKALAKMEKHLVGSFKDAEKKKQAELRASEFSATLYTSTEEILNYNQFDEETLVDYNAVESELLAVLENYSQEWNSMLQALVKVHVELAEIATQDEWKSVSKALKNII